MSSKICTIYEEQEVPLSLKNCLILLCFGSILSDLSYEKAILSGKIGLEKLSSTKGMKMLPLKLPVRVEQLDHPKVVISYPQLISVVS